MKKPNYLVGLDDFFSIPETNFKGVGVNYSGTKAVVASPHHEGTFLEFLDHKAPPIRLFEETADTVGFFGSTKDLLAIEHDGLLRIIHMQSMEIVAVFSCKTGSLFVPQSGKSPRIGVVSPQGKTIIISDDLSYQYAGLTVSDGYEVLWGQSVTPVGYTWVDETSANVYIHPFRSPGVVGPGKGATFSSGQGISVYAAWESVQLGRNEAYISTYDEPNILQRVTTDETGAPIIEPVVSFRKDILVSDVVTSPLGAPIVVSGTTNTKTVVKYIPPRTDVASLLGSILTKDSRLSSMRCMGMVSTLSWSETPVTEPICSVIAHGIEDRPVKELQSYKDSSSFAPKFNHVRSFTTKDGQKITYRLVSPLDPKEHLTETTVIIPDFYGRVAGGHFSPTVKMLYSMGIPVALVAVNRRKGSLKVIIDDLSLDIVDVAYDMQKNMISKKFMILAHGVCASPSIESLRVKKSPIRNVVVVNPEITGGLGRIRFPEKITTIRDKDHPGLNLLGSWDRVLEEDEYDYQDLQSIIVDYI